MGPGNPMRFIVYDTETSGLDTKFDQVFQFAAILADERLNQLDQFEIRCRRLPHIVPSPKALLVTGITPRLLDEAEHSHHEMFCKVMRKLDEWSGDGAVFMGFNSIRFDEHLLRQAYYQNLLPLYQTQTNGNSRADVMRIAQACAIYDPKAIKVPRGGEFKLGQLAEANGIELKDAHDALSDTRATLAIAKHIRERSPKVWETMLRNATKPGVEEALKPIESCFSDVWFGKPYNFVVTEAGRNADRDGEIGLFDLAFDPKEFLGLSEEKLAEYIGGKVKVIRRMRTNGQPMLFPIEAMPSDVRGGRQTPEVYATRAQMIRENPSFRKRVSQALELCRAEDAEEQADHVEVNIYNGFAHRDDEIVMDRFHKSSWEARMELCEKLKDPRYRELALRLVYFEHPELLAPDLRDTHKEFVRSRIFADDTVKWMTISKALTEVAELRKSRAGSDLKHLDQIETHLRGIAEQWR